MYTAEEKAWMALNTIRGMNAIILYKIIATYPDITRIFGESEMTILNQINMPKGLANNISNMNWQNTAEREIENAKKLDCRIITINHSDYPNHLRNIPYPPKILYFKGEQAPNMLSRHLAIVGNRKASPYGIMATRNIVAELIDCQVAIISGLAYGIDAEAHRTAAHLDGVTFAVCAHGLDQLYPRSHHALSRSIQKSGGLISEFAFGTPPLKPHFPRRNRLISGIAQGCLILEAGKKSGALITANWALEQAREIFALPGPYYSKNSEGCHWLIQQGAKLFTSLNDVFSELNWELEKHESDLQFLQSEVDLFKSSEYNRLLKVVHKKPLHIDELVACCELPINKLQSMLFELEMKGKIISWPGKYYSLL